MALVAQPKKIIMHSLKYLTGYPATVIAQAHTLITEQRLGEHLLNKYPSAHTYGTDTSLYNYTQALKSRYLGKVRPLTKVRYDNNIKVIQHALGQHVYVSRQQGKQLKAINEIRIASLFRKTPEPMLKMIVVHELAHFKEKEHNKAFYQLCRHMEPDYHQLEFDLRLYLTHVDLFGELYC